MSLFELPIADGEIEARADGPLPGWTIDGAQRLTQDQTDTLIRCELYYFGTLGSFEDERDIREAVLGAPSGIQLQDDYQTAQRGRCWMMAAPRQRGGIDTDPHVRGLAFRAWRDRDRAWRALDALVEEYREALKLRPWAEYAAGVSEWAPGDRRTGRTTRGILTTLAKCRVSRINVIMLRETRFAMDFVYPLLLSTAARLGIGAAVRVRDERRGMQDYIAHHDHYELENRRDQRDAWLG